MTHFEATIEIARPPVELVMRTLSGPTPFVYRYAFTSSGSATRISLDADVELNGVAALLGPVAGQAVKRGVEANFRTLRGLLEPA